MRVAENMDALDSLHEMEFDARAQFFNRTIEEELVGSLYGDRGPEARSRLELLASQRRTTVQELIRAQWDAWLQRDMQPNLPSTNVPMDGTYMLDTSPCAAQEAPLEIFRGECPVCCDNTCKCLAMACGHVICQPCFDKMASLHIFIDAWKRVKCPTCRKPSQKLWSLDEIPKKNAKHQNRVLRFSFSCKKK